MGQWTLGSGYVWDARRRWWLGGCFEGKGWRPGSRAPQIHFQEWVDLVQESWQAMAVPPVRLRNSWKSIWPLELMYSFFIMHWRTPGSSWFFVKAASSVFMKVRNSVLETVQLLPSFPAYFWKTAETRCTAQPQWGWIFLPCLCGAGTEAVTGWQWCYFARSLNTRKIFHQCVFSS